MLFPSVVGDDQREVGFVRFKNADSVTIPYGAPVSLSLTTPDGVKATRPVAASLGLFLGIVAGPGGVLVNEYAIAQAYGFATSARVSGVVAAGNILIPAAGATHLVDGGAATGLNGLAYAVVLTTGLPADPSVVFLRAL